jgi:ABC-type spermidine/putrescine transport system permease subunit II
MRRTSWFNVTSVTLGLAFLYLPILLLVIYSFNASKLVTVWGASRRNGTASCCATRRFWTRRG